MMGLVELQVGICDICLVGLCRVGGRVLVLPLGTEMVVEQLPASEQQPPNELDK